MKAANTAYFLENKELALRLYNRIQDDYSSSREGQNIGKYIARINAAN